MLKEIIQTVKIVDKLHSNSSSTSSPKFKPKSKVDHMNTKTTKQVMQISDAAQKQLSIVGNEIIQLLDKGTTYQKIQDQLKIQVGTIISNAVRESYLSGFHFIESFEQRSIKLTMQHVNNINTEIDAQIKSYWNSIQKIISNNTVTSSTSSNQLKPKPSSSSSPPAISGAAGGFGDLLTNLFTNLAISLAPSLAFLSLGKATITTQKQAFTENKKIGDKSATAHLHGNSKVIWITENDSSVCPICRPLHNRVWFTHQSNIPNPVKDTHPRCRCRLMPITKGRVYNA